ncbi:hypothetical protein NM208_g8753 [Fusarium decemcellulare]|uniref:Uncharacterized protein n=1 Tax=Fusarium decemcellulare TaxID=57161 RepID=A0ACC1S492_9HYPO|nr:hypothetical protein NM208_g8753 [Fusarium decemcellulare]
MLNSLVSTRHSQPYSHQHGLRHLHHPINHVKHIFDPQNFYFSTKPTLVSPRPRSSPPALPVPTPTSSYWLDDPPFPALCDIQADLPKEADVVIIGSGITGAAVAKSLLELSDDSELKVVVFEARQLCSGATGRNGGHIKCTPYEEFALYRQKLGPENARRVVRFKRKHLEVLKQIGERVPEGEAREVQTVDLFLERNDFEKAKHEVEEMKKWLPEEEARVWEAEEVRKEFGANELVIGGISYSAGALWPYRLVTGVWNDLIGRFSNLSINTNTPVESISSEGSTYTVKTPAEHSRPSIPGFDYVTQRPDREDGTPGDLMIGGGFFRSRQQGLDQVGIWDDSQVHALPLMHVRGVMPTVFEPQWGEGSKFVKAWTGILGFTGDLMPFVGPVPGRRSSTPSSGEWVAAGFNGEGMVWAWLCGTALAVMVLGKEERDESERRER